VSDLPHWAVCQIHNANELQTVDSFKACGECWHVWQTEADFWADVDWEFCRQGDDPWPRDQPVYTCPLCSHDF
jgi:hypothetical protein